MSLPTMPPEIQLQIAKFLPSDAAASASQTSREMEGFRMEAGKRKHDLQAVYDLITNTDIDGRTRFNAYCAHIAEAKYKTYKGIPVADSFLNGRDVEPSTWIRQILKNIVDSMDNVTWADVCTFSKACNFGTVIQPGGFAILHWYIVRTNNLNSMRSDTVGLDIVIHEAENPMHNPTHVPTLMLKFQFGLPGQATGNTGGSFYALDHPKALALREVLDSIRVDPSLGFRLHPNPKELDPFWDALIDLIQNAPIIRQDAGREHEIGWYLLGIMMDHQRGRISPNDGYPFAAQAVSGPVPRQSAGPKNLSRITFRAAFADACLV